MWVKRGIINDSSVFETLIGGGPTNADTFGFGSGTNAAGDYLHIRDSAVGSYNLLTTQLFRDPSSWYHLVLAVDTTQATASNRVKLYVNGVQVTSFSSASYPAQNYVFDWNTASTVCAIGRRSGGNSSWYYDGYFAEMYFVDGQQLTPSSFGAISTNGVWQPTAYTGTYGTNGFYLKFNSFATAAALGTDSSGNGNTWTVNNLSVTTGATYDSMLDVPTLTSATVANYCTFNPLDISSSVTLSNGNLAALAAGGGVSLNIRSTYWLSTGKWYWETTITTMNGAMMTGIANASVSQSGSGLNQTGAYIYYGTSGANGLYKGGTNTSAAATFTNGDVIGIAFDADNLTIQFFKNNTSQGTLTALTAGTYSPAVSCVPTTGAWTANFGQQGFTYTPPSGFVALNTYNLSTPTIPNGAVYFAATTYTGTGATQVVTNTVNGTAMQPDWVWQKSRSAARDHRLMDTNRGINNVLCSDLSQVEYSGSILSSVNSNGFTLNTADQGNNNGETYVAWQWKANAGTNVSNTSGSITSTVSASTTAGFSIVTYTGTGANATVGHGLGVAPSFIIARARNTDVNWYCYSSTFAAGNIILLNTTQAAQSVPTAFNSGTATSTTFPVGADSTTNGNGKLQVAYCFAPIAGYSAFGSYTGNGSTDGPFVYLGFRPRFWLVKRTDSSNNWMLEDTSRDPSNVASLRLCPDANYTEAGTSANYLDFVSNGMKIRTSDTPWNASGGTYIYMAFAENPFKYSLAR